MNKLVKTVSTDSLSYEFIKSLNGLLDLTEREIELFSEMLKVQLGITKIKKDGRGIDGTGMRKLYMSNTGITRDNLSRYMTKFKSKKILMKEKDGTYSINKALIPIIIGGKTVQITMILKVD